MKSLFLIWVVLFAGHFTPTREFPLNEYPILISYKADIKPRKNQDYRRTEYVKLFIHPTESIFIDNKLWLLNRTSKRNLSPQDRAREVSMIGLPYFRFYLVKDYRENSTSIIEEYLNGGHNAFKQNSMTTESWTILNSSDSTIVGLKAYKAECQLGGRTWIAWFTPEIPISDGPYKFSGLPGLILKLDSTEGDFSFHISGIQKQLPTEDLPDIPTYNLLSENKFKEIQQMISDNPFAKFQSKGNKIEGNITVGDKVMTQEEYILFLKNDRKNSNYIEEN